MKETESERGGQIQGERHEVETQKHQQDRERDRERQKCGDETTGERQGRDRVTEVIRNTEMETETGRDGAEDRDPPVTEGK